MSNSQARQLTGHSFRLVAIGTDEKGERVEIPLTLGSDGSLSSEPLPDSVTVTHVRQPFFGRELSLLSNCDDDASDE